MKCFLGIPTILFLTVAASAQAPPAEPPSTITQAAEASISAAPDEGYIVGGVVTTAAEVNAAMDQNAQIMARVSSALRSAGITETSVTTVEFSIDDHFKRVRDSNNEVSQVRDGYTVTNRIKVTIAGVSRIGPTLDVMTAAGANSIQGIQLGNSRSEEFTDQARSKAVAAATHRAGLVARALGYTLGPVVSAREIVGHGRYDSGERNMTSLSAAPAVTLISGGSQEFRAGVTVTWKLVPSPAGK